MLILTTSPAAILNKSGQPDQQLIQSLKNICNSGIPVGVLSNHSEPPWFQAAFAGTQVTHLRAEARQSGAIIREIAKHFKVETYDVLVLAVKPEDVQMAKNGRAVLIGAGWATDRQVSALGLQVNNNTELEELIQFTSGWNGSWWYKGEMQAYSARALVNLSSYGKSLSTAQQDFGKKLTATVKNGGSRLAALLTVTARSLLIDRMYDVDDLIWGVYPSSSNTTKQDEVLTDFCRRLRTTVSRVHFAKNGEPLFIRHTASSKRSAGGNSGNRTDPTEQITTIHLNPFYRKKIAGRNAIVIDDCTTYGVSFAVASAFLRQAGANSVNGIALGKFGNQLNYYDISINTDPFQPVFAGQFTARPMRTFAGNTDATAQNVLLRLIP